MPLDPARADALEVEISRLRVCDLQSLQARWCEHCLKLGRIVPATIADHKIPHRGDLNLFWTGELQSLCHPCHVGWKHEQEVRGYSSEVGLDGWPVDDRHPANQTKGRGG